jgi:hypothetical protein
MPPAAHRENAFHRAITDALSRLSGADAVTEIMRLYAADTQALMARADGAAHEASEAARASRRHYDMLLQVQNAASQGIWDRAKLSAELSAYKGLYDRLKHMADVSDGAPIPSEDLAAALTPEPVASVHPAVTVAFVASGQFRGGQFLSPEGDVTFVFTFIGWALVDHGPGALGCVEPMFLVGDRALPRSVIEHERRCKLETFLPNLESIRAA